MPAGSAGRHQDRRAVWLVHHAALGTSMSPEDR
jgi:hypothetical protein